MSLQIKDWSTTYNEEDRPQKNTLDFHIEVHWEADAEGVCVCEEFLAEARPLLGYLAHLRAAVRRENLQWKLVSLIDNHTKGSES